MYTLAIEDRKENTMLALIAQSLMIASRMAPQDARHDDTRKR
jgi:hypothetical protein